MENEYLQNNSFNDLETTQKIARSFGNKSTEDLNYLASYLNQNNTEHFFIVDKLIKFSEGLLKNISKFEGENIEIYDVKEYFSNDKNNNS